MNLHNGGTTVTTINHKIGFTRLDVNRIIRQHLLNHLKEIRVDVAAHTDRLHETFRLRRTLRGHLCAIAIAEYMDVGFEVTEGVFVIVCINNYVRCVQVSSLKKELFDGEKRFWWRASLYAIHRERNSVLYSYNDGHSRRVACMEPLSDE